MDVGKMGSVVGGALGGKLAVGTSGGTEGAPSMPGFGQVLQQVVNQAVQANQQAANLTVAAAQGQDVPLQDVIQAVSRAELTLQTLVSVRDRAVEAYQEIIRMPV